MTPLTTVEGVIELSRARSRVRRCRLDLRALPGAKSGRDTWKSYVVARHMQAAVAVSYHCCFQRRTKQLRVATHFSLNGISDERRDSGGILMAAGKTFVLCS